MPPDYEEYPQFVFNIMARDRGTPALIGRSRVTINILDVNDNAPVFVSSFYR